MMVPLVRPSRHAQVVNGSPSHQLYRQIGVAQRIWLPVHKVSTRTTGRLRSRTVSAAPCAVALLPSTRPPNRRSRRTASALRAQRATRATAAAARLLASRAPLLHSAPACARRVARAGPRSRAAQLVRGAALAATQLVVLARAHRVRRVISPLLGAARARPGARVPKGSVKWLKDQPLLIVLAHHAPLVRRILMWIAVLLAPQSKHALPTNLKPRRRARRPIVCAKPALRATPAAEDHPGRSAMRVGPQC